MKRVILGAVAALTFATGQAFADGPPSRSRIAAPVTSVAPNWNGFHLGVGIGAGAFAGDYSKSVNGYEYKSTEYGGEGFFGTVSVGFDRVIRSGWVLGVFADYDFGSNMSAEKSSFGYSTSLDQGDTWSVGARLGYLVNPSTLVYGTAGYTQTEFEVFGHGSKTFDGYFVGAGIETFLRQNWTLKLEYRYSDFGDQTVASWEAWCNEFSKDLDPSSHTARLVLSYKFGGREEAGSIKD
jgi:outer membrane immunogenic protein